MKPVALIGNDFLVKLRLKIPLLIGIFFLFSLVVERVDLDSANPDLEFLLRQTSVRYLNYDFQITVQPSRLTVKVKANLEVTVRSTRLLYFVLSNAYQPQISDLRVNTYPADFDGRGGWYRIELPFWYKKGDNLELELVYTLKNNTRSRRVIAELSSDWYPKNLLPELVTARFQLDVPDGYTGVANGRLVTVERLSNGVKRYCWLQDEPATALGVSAGKYQLLTRNFQGRLFRLFYLPGLNRTIQEETLECAARLSEFYYTKFGGRDLSYLTIVFSDTFWEETSLGSLIFLHYQSKYSDESRKTLFFNLAHELAHFWWGNQVIPKRLDDWWLVEGFANYAVLLATQLPEFEINEIRREVLLEKWRAQYCQTTINLNHYKMAEMSLAEIGPFDLQRELLYTKGAFVLQMLSDYLGADNFERYLYEFIKRFQYKVAGIEDFTRLGAEFYGAESVDFFRQWVYSTGSYNLALRDWELIKIGNRYRITVTVANTGHLYLPDLVNVEIITSRRVYLEALRLTDLNVKMQKVLPEQPLRVVINAQHQILETDLSDNILEIR